MVACAVTASNRQLLLVDLRVCYQTYFKNALEYLETSPGGPTASDITGVWISTDGEDVVDEVHGRVLVLESPPVGGVSRPRAA